MGAKHVADITRAVIAGAGGRISKKAEQSLTDGEVIEQVKDFLDIISTAFSDLAARGRRTTQRPSASPRS